MMPRLTREATELLITIGRAILATPGGDARMPIEAIWFLLVVG